jgi:hypothetical protein
LFFIIERVPFGYSWYYGRGTTGSCEIGHVLGRRTGLFTPEANDLKQTLRDPMHKVGLRLKENGIQGSETKRYGPDF